MPAPDPPQDAARRSWRGPASVAYWMLAGVVYIALGVAVPPAFLLGFQESVIYVFAVTALQPWVLRRIR